MSVRGEAGWHATHQKAFGKERWPALYKALRSKVSHVAFVNPFMPPEAQASVREQHGLRPHGSIPMAWERAAGDPSAKDDDEGIAAPAGAVEVDGGAAPAAEAVDDGTLPLYFLDGASVIAAMCLGVQPGDSVLDLCAAPGGKSVVLASLLFAPRRPSGGAAADGGSAAPAAVAAPPPPAGGGLLVCNEASRTRVQRLQRVVASWVPKEMMAPGGGVAVTNVDATASAGPAPAAITRFGLFDRVLVDAPCSSDRHLAHQGKVALSHWATGVVKSNAERQLDILLCAATLVKPGGLILYCTCALSEQENDGVVAKFLKKAGRSFASEPLEEVGSGESDGDDAARLAELVQPVAERTAAGALILPDRASYGPMYIARLRRA